MTTPDQSAANARSSLNDFNRQNDPDYDTMKSIVARSIAEGAGGWDSDPLPSMADNYVSAFGGEVVLTGGRQGAVSPGSMESLRGPDGVYRVEIPGPGETPIVYGDGSGGNSPEQVEIVGRHMTDEEKAAYDLAQLDQMGQPLNGPSNYDAGAQFGRIWSSNGSLGGKLGRTWDWMNYTTPDAKQRLSNYAAQAQADAARWGRIDALRSSGLAGIAVTAGHVAGASDRTLDALAQGGGALEGALGGAGGWKTLTLAPQMPNSLASRVRDPRTGRFALDPENPPSPYTFTDAQRRQEWRNLAQDPNSPLTPTQRAEVEARGWRGPQRVNEFGEIETMELSHEPIPLRDGGTTVVPRWPADHAAVDPYRQLKKRP